MSNKDILINQIKELQSELRAKGLGDDILPDVLPIWVQLGKCFLLAYELLNKKEYEELVLALFYTRMQYSSMEYCQTIINNFVHHYLESVEKRIKKRKEFHPSCKCTVTPIVFNTEEAQFTESMKQQAEAIARAYRVPIHLLGDFK